MEERLDTARRVGAFRKFHVGRNVLDFGCGAGDFLRAIEPTAGSVCGVELHRLYSERLNMDGIQCFTDTAEIPSLVDTIFMFHVLEHLPDPLMELIELRKILDLQNGALIIEVPNANDFLISQLACQPFIDFTLWSQHLVLHTKDSLHRLLVAAGFVDVQIAGVQRYGIANHLTWLSEAKPGGHSGNLSLFQTETLSQAYEAALAAQDCTDTLIAIARVR